MHGRILGLIAVVTFVASAVGAEPGPKLAAVPIEGVKVEDPFWSPKRDVWRRVTIGDCFDKFERDGAFENFDKVRDGKGGKHAGPQWYDGLVYEMITGSADFLRERRDEGLERRIDGYVARIAAAADRDPDGYVNTHTQLVEPEHRWGMNGGDDRQQHDLYNAGCLVEAGVHYYRATGKTELLRVAVRLANTMCDVMGPPPRKNVVPGHALGEGAMVELYQLFREQPDLKGRLPLKVEEGRYLELARFWVDNRGNHAGRRDLGAYDQDHKPVAEQETIEGHAVRATLLATGVTELALVTGREEYRRVARRWWENMTGRRMYVTGGVGALAHDEKFGGDWVLPNDGYAETCASVGAAFFHERMNLDAGEARYADELERVLYNGALAGVSLGGDRYFYENPLEAGKNRVRWPWHSCPCCPPMFLKLMGAMPGYVYATGEQGVYVNLYVGSTVRARVGGNEVVLRQSTRYPWEGDVRLTVESEGAGEFGLNLRVPAWCQGVGGVDELYTVQGRPAEGAFVVRVNGEVVSPKIVDGYAQVSRAWRRGDVVEVRMEMPARRVVANSKVAAAAGRVALVRGPIVYCLESIDNDGRVRNVSLPDEGELRTEFRADLLGGVVVIRATGEASFAGEAGPRAAEVTAIPFYANANRAAASRGVWIPRSAAGVVPAVLSDDESSAAPPAPVHATIRVDAGAPGKAVSRFLTGACIEDVNHEIYGGIYSQMIFGESFQEPPVAEVVKGFWSPDGVWRVRDGEVHGEAGAGPKLIMRGPPVAEGEAGVEVYLGRDGVVDGGGTRNAGLIVAVNRAGPGADNFLGYEISVDAGRKRLIIGRHQRDFRLLREVECEVAAGRWISLAVRFSGKGAIEAMVDGKSVAKVEDPRPLPAGAVGLRQWQRAARYRKMWVKSGERGRTELPFEKRESAGVAVSGMWSPVVAGSAVLEALVERERPFVGGQSQRVTFARGEGEVGIANDGLNRWGMNLVAGKVYEGYVWVRAERGQEVMVGLESRDGARAYARASVAVEGGGEWRRYDFKLTPDGSDRAGRFSVRLKAVGSVVVGHVFLQPGEWGRFKGLPVRGDVVEALVEQGISVLRYGGSMVNAPEYRWKKMIGPRDRRPPYKGTWYPQSSNGWGIVDFLDLCEAAGFVGIPDFNADETPQDMADFVEYVNGPAESEWGRRRAADGHPAPYGVRHIEFGNEEKVDEAYWRKFEAVAKAVWAKDPDVVLVVGDFQYERPIVDAMDVRGAASRITSLAAHKKILDLARERGREVWFDVHMWTEGPGDSPSGRAFSSYVDAIDRLAGGAKHRVVVFEFNANNHDQRRALANAAAIGRVERDGRVPVALSANCLQPDGQNDNGWDQGLLFLNPEKVWLQPPGYVTRMVARSRLDVVVPAEVAGGAGLDVTAERSGDGKVLVVRVVNAGNAPVDASLQVKGLTVGGRAMRVTDLAGPLDAVNTAARPDAIVPKESERRLAGDGEVRHTFAPRSFTVIRFE